MILGGSSVIKTALTRAAGTVRKWTASHRKLLSSAASGTDKIVQTLTLAKMGAVD
jgi:hypothetical protein